MNIVTDMNTTEKKTGIEAVAPWVPNSPCQSWPFETNEFKLPYATEV